MLHAVDFHRRRRRGDMTYTLQNNPFPLNIMSRDRVPQQDRGGNCGAHTLRLIEYLAANRDTFDWSENEMGTIREKMVVEMPHLRQYSSGKLMLGPSLTIGGLEHRLQLSSDCPHLLHYCVVVLSEDEACRPSIGRPDCLFDFRFKTIRNAMSDGTTYEEGWPTCIIVSEYALISVSLPLVVIRTHM
ncbi:hypothetical protein LWI28_025916 [Acer negundo]|uniref:Ubiquitin-like protease family profile domain-containing protein n=1 Tax=Acer negundo TaxID=4023 RepID=A0AAD5JEK9_ACENE|nr:hypothetical protein LWI28_025916 [Acer negundo]